MADEVSMIMREMNTVTNQSCAGLDGPTAECIPVGRAASAPDVPSALRPAAAPAANWGNWCAIGAPAAS